MRPSIPSFYRGNSRSSNAVSESYFLLRKLTSVQHGFNLAHIVFCQLGLRKLFSVSYSSAIAGVAHIVEVASKNKVQWIAASTIGKIARRIIHVASMLNLEAFWNWAIRQFPSKPVSSDHFIFETDYPVSVFLIHGKRPQTAFSSRNKSRPESCVRVCSPRYLAGFVTKHALAISNLSRHKIAGLSTVLANAWNSLNDCGRHLAGSFSYLFRAVGELQPVNCPNLFSKRFLVQ